MSFRKSIAISSLLFLICITISIITIAAPPPNPFWAITSGYYRYDPRRNSPPKRLIRDRPEDSLGYFLDATLRLCGGVYPAPINRTVVHYEVEQVEYFGKTDYHAFSHVHTRLYFADGSSALAVFRLEAGYNEFDLLWSLGDTSAIGAGSWMAFGLARDPVAPPPGWIHYQEHERPYTCPKQPELYSLNG